jgi:hypothetical protein
VDTFDPKPALAKWAGKPIPGGNLTTERPLGAALPSPFAFRAHGRSGIEVSEIFPHTARHVDDLCFIRGLHTDTPAHPQAVIQLHTGARNASLTRPSLGSWLLYGLGSENEDLPGYIAINPAPNFGGAINYGNAFLPASFQGTRITDTGELPNLRAALPRDLQRSQLDLVQRFNRSFQASPVAPREIDGVIASAELAFRMQDTVPDLLDVSREPQSVLDAYGVKPGKEGSFARQCLMARRMSEAGVRFVEVSQGSWDHHASLNQKLTENCNAIDRPMYGLITDLKQRGLLDETLIVWAGEFGRTPYAQGRDGRDHNHKAFSLWMAGGGIAAGKQYGRSGDFGVEATENPVPVVDFHATLLALLGLDHQQLTYPYAGRDFRLTDTKGQVIRELIG